MKKITQLSQNSYETDPDPSNQLTERDLDSTLNRCHPKKGPEMLLETLDSTFRIVCINCQELIPSSLIDFHSKICQSVSSIILNLENYSDFEQIVFKQSKLIRTLEEITEKHELKPIDKNYLLVLLRIGLKIIGSHNIEEIQISVDSLVSLLNNFRGSLSVKVYIERFYSLVILQKSAIFDEVKISFDRLLQKKIEKKKKEVNDITKKIGQYRDRNDILEKAVAFANNLSVPTIKQRVDIIHSGKESLNSSFSGDSQCSDSENRVSEIEDDFDYDEDEENLKKHFYSICLGEKIRAIAKYKERSKIKNIWFGELYRSAIEKRILTEKWEEFIRTEFEMRINCIANTRKKKVRSPFTRKYFETIIEEGSRSDIS